MKAEYIAGGLVLRNFVPCLRKWGLKLTETNRFRSEPNAGATVDADDVWRHCRAVAVSSIDDEDLPKY